MLDTNMVTKFVQGRREIVEQIIGRPIEDICVSVITEGELLYGLARRPQAHSLRTIVLEFLRRIDVLPWDRDAASEYGEMRAALGRRGQTLEPNDILIAAHAVAAGAVLVTNDRAFKQVGGLMLEDWSAV